jgi:ATP-dependent Lhr-like helicase
LFIYDLNPFATLRLQIIVAFKPWKEEEIKLVKKQAKKVKVSPEEMKRMRRVYRNASIVRSQGKRWLLRLPVGESGLKWRQGLLKIMRVDEEAFSGIF